MRLYHNPRCSKSRQAVDLLKSRGIEFEDYRYLDSGIAEEDLELLSSLTGIIRTNEKEYKSMTFDINNPNEVAHALTDVPKILQRPVLISGKKAVIGRPPENILSLL